MSFDCLDCSAQFPSAEKLFIHCLEVRRHRFGCKTCSKEFILPSALTQHIQNSSAHHGGNGDSSFKKSAEKSIFFCSGCGCSFIDTVPSRSNLCFACARDQQPSAVGRKMKNKAKVLNQHKPGQKFKCLFCRKKFKTPSAVTMHIESGRHSITRHQVTAAVHKLAIVPTISVDRRLEGPILPPATIVTYVATELAFNGTAYECYLCHDTFRRLKSLNAHLNSPVHDDDEFKCPGIKCHSEFKLISGLIQHIECGTCGLAKFKEVKSHFESLTDQFSRSLKL